MKHNVAVKRCNSFELRGKGVQNPRVERGTLSNVCRICLSNPLIFGIRDVGGNNGSDIAFELGIGPDLPVKPRVATITKTYVTLSAEAEKTIPSSSQSPIMGNKFNRHRSQDQHKLVINGTLATC